MIGIVPVLLSDFYLERDLVTNPNITAGFSNPASTTNIKYALYGT